MLTLIDSGNRKLAFAGDFNMPPEDWYASGYLELYNLKLIIIAAGPGKMKHGRGWSTFDYIIIDVDLEQLIFNVTTVTDAPWGPHVGISFEINRRSEEIVIPTLRKP